ncbi:MAG: heme biosynthesis protein HemY, partial [Hyphomicrobiales bacterium]|nr:heme biosynthesis protein HemY [Hyphomicrobiales bacterium]
AALEARAFDEAREAVAPLISGDGDAPARPTRRACLLMADLEQTQGGTPGAVREWLARAAIAPRDPAWIADGVIADRWSPVSPVTGKLDAFAWRAPDERITDAPALPLSAEPADARAKGEAHAIPPREAEPALIEHAAPAATEPPPAPAHPAPPADAEPPIRPLPPRSLPPVEARALPGAPDDPGPHEDAPPRKRGWFD